MIKLYYLTTIGKNKRVHLSSSHLFDFGVFFEEINNLLLNTVIHKVGLVDSR